jgi:hypothetical protein
MKKIMMVMALMMVGTIIFAQRKPHDGKKVVERSSEFMKKSLLLTDDQYSKVKALNENFAKQFKVIRMDTAMTQGKARTQLKKLRDEHQAQLRSVLNDPQWAKWSDMKDKRKNGRRHDHHKQGHEMRRG